MKHGFCPYFLNKEVKDSFNEIIEALGGRPMTDEEFRNVELRKQRTGRDLTAMNAAYKIWELNKGNLIDLAPNGEPSILFDKYLKYFDHDRTKAIIAKSQIYSDQYIKYVGNWTDGNSNINLDKNGEPLSGAVPFIRPGDKLVVYQGYNSLDNRRYNYWTLDKEEAEHYGSNVRKRTIDTSNFLSYYGDPVANDIRNEFKKLTGKTFDILDNSEEGLRTQQLFFDFVRSKGYSGVSFVETLSLTDNRYLVSFDDSSMVTADPRVHAAIIEFANRLGFELKNVEDSEVFVDFTNKVITLQDFNSKEFNEIKAEVAMTLMPSELKKEIIKAGKLENQGPNTRYEKVYKDILGALNNQKNWISEDKTLFEKIKKFISDLINKILKNQQYYESLIYKAAQDISDVNSKWYRTVIQDGFDQKGLDILKLQQSPQYNIYKVLVGLGAALDGSAAVRTQGTLYRAGEEDFHDLDFSKPFDDFSWDVHMELEAFYLNYRSATNYFKNLDKVVYKDLRKYMLENCNLHFKNSVIYKKLSRYYTDIEVVHAADTKQLGLFVTIRVDGTSVDIFYPGKTVKMHTINGIQVVDFSVPFAAKLVMGRDKDIRDIINFHKFRPKPITNPNKKQYIKPETTFSSITTEDDLMSAESKYEELNELVLSEEFKKLEARLDHVKGKGYSYIISKVLKETYKYIYDQFKKALGKKGYELKFVRYDGNDSVYHVKRKESDSNTTAQKTLEQSAKPLQNNVTTSVRPNPNFNRNIHYFMGDRWLMEQEQKDLDGFYEELANKKPYTTPKTTFAEARGSEDLMSLSTPEQSLIDYIQQNSDEEVTRGELGVDKAQLIALLGSTMYKANVQSVAVKELLLNAFDAVKIAMSTNAINKGVIDIWLNRKDRTVTVKDNGTGMTPEIVQKAFFTIGGSYKGDNVDNRLKSGGLGLAKMAFLFSSDYVEVSTVKNGVKTYVKATPEQIKSESGFNIITSRTNEPNGTQVTVKIPENYIDENENTRSIYFESSPSFLSKPMIGNVQLNVHTTNVWSDSTEDTSYDKSGIPEGYGYIGKATTDFGDMDLYIRHVGGKTNYINCSILISGLYQFNHNIYMRDGGEQVEIIANILPTVGVKSKLYPINNLREGFRSVVEPEIKDLDFLLKRISNVLQRKSVVAAFLGTVSMDVKDISRPQRVVDKKAMLDDVLKDIKKEIKQASTKKSNDDNTLDFKAVRSIRENSEKLRSSSFNASGIKLNDQQAQIDTSHLDINKPLFHNNTTMEIEEDGRLFLNALGELLMELKQLYIQTYSSDKGLVSRFEDQQICEYISKQFWGFSFDKNYGGVNVHPSVLPLLSINPFYLVPRANESNKLTYLVGAIMHLIHHEFNHNYVGGEGAAFTGRFLSTLAEFYGIGRSFTKEWLNKLYKLVNENINVIIKYHERYTNSENRGESFESDRIGGPTESRNTSEQGLFEDVSRDRSREDVSSYGEEVRDLYMEVQKAKTRQRKPYTRPEIRANLEFALRGDIMSLENPTANSPRQKTQDVIEENKKTQQTLTNKIQSLYNQYRRMKGKSATKQRVQNAIFELNNKIRHLELQNTINEILNFITERVGYEDVLGNTGNPNTVLQYLKDQNTTGFANVDSSKLMDIYKNTILPIGSILQDIAQDDIFTECPGIDEAGRIAMNQTYDKCKAGLKKVTELWTEAMFVVSDRIVDDIIDREVFLPEKESKEEMRDIVKDFLHKTLSTGDITSLEYFVGNFGRSRNPIVKQAFHLITATEAQTRRELVPMITKIVKAYQKADSIFKRADWLLALMELDRKGRPTGNFVRPINYGLYELDLNDFIKDLNDKFDRAYGHHYFYDETNTFVNSATFEDASLEEWTYDANGNAIAPDVVEYWKAVYEWKCLRANLRYTKNYYFERLSEPYDIDENPLLTNGRILKHGLSPKTLILYNEIQSKINYYLDQCIEDDGYSHPENLDSESKKKLNDAMEELAELSNPYEPNSFTPKPYIQRKVAYEILSWQKFINEKTYTVAEINDFNNLATKVYNESVSKGDPKLFSDFIRYNARFTVNPEYITMVFGTSPDPDTLDSNLYKAKLMKSAIQALVRPDASFPVIINGKPILTRNLQRYENNMDFWTSCKILDEEIEANRPKRDKAFFETIKKYFKFEKLPYLDARNQVIDKTTGQPTNDLNKALSFFEYIVEKYTNIAESNGYIPGVVDSTGRLVSFTGTHDEIKDLVTNLFTYERTFYDSIADEYVTQREPLSIFTMMLPTYAKFTNPRTQQVEDTVLYYPTRLFTKKENKDFENYMNTEFDHAQNIAEQPLESLYGNQKAYDKMRKYYGDYYDVLIDTMKYAWSLYDPEKKFNYKVPLINASNALVLSRLLSQGFENTAKFFIDSITLIQANDEYAVREDELLKGPDGRLIKALPTRFVRPLKDPGTVSYSLMETVTLFLESALNFKNKSTIRDDIELLGQALEDQSKRVGSNKHSVDQFNAMMNRHFYQMLLGSREDQSAKSVLAEKTARAIQTLATKQMLGLNLMSASVGFGDSVLSQIQDSFGLKYATPLEGIRATWEVIYRIPAMLHNWGNPLPNNKISGLMFFLGLDGSLRNVFKYANRSLVRRKFKDFLMNPFLAGDYISRGMIITQYAMDILFYPGDGVDIEPGFYTREQLKNIMYANGYTHKEFWNARSLNNVSLWDMLHFDRKESQIVITNDPALLRYVPYINNWLLNNVTTKGQLRSALANGMNPDNDTPIWKSKISGIFVGAMRGFITQRIQNQFVAGNETVLRTPQVERKESVSHGTTKSYPTMPKIPKYTDEQRYRRASWNYETGTTNDAAGTALWRAAGTLRRKIARLCKFDFGGMKQAKFSPTELYGLRNAGIVLVMLITMLSLWPVLHDWAASIAVPPKDREDAGMTELYYMKDRFINDGLWALYLDDLAFRLIESLLTTMDPTTLYALIGQVTTLSSGMENTIKPLVYWGGFMLNSALGNEIDHDPDDVIKDSGAFKYYTYKERSLFYALGPLRNLHTATSYYGLMYNLKYYVSQYGKIYPLVGYDYTKAYPKKKKVSEMDFDEQMQYYEEQALKKLDALMEGDVL